VVKIIIFTVLISRAFLFLVWDNDLFLTQKTDGWHHMYTGVIVMALARIVPKRVFNLFFGIGLGLLTDELIHIFHILGITAETDYWSFKSIATTVLGLLLILGLAFIYKKKQENPRRSRKH
jgi:LPXTG-motif cell wall-anchored protein